MHLKRSMEQKFFIELNALKKRFFRLVDQLGKYTNNMLDTYIFKCGVFIIL